MKRHQPQYGPPFPSQADHMLCTKLQRRGDFFMNYLKNGKTNQIRYDVMTCSYCDTGMCLYSTQNNLFGVPQGLQLLLHLFYHHGKGRFGMSCQALSSELWHSRSQTLRILFCQNRRDAQNTTGLREEWEVRQICFRQPK